MGDFAVKMMGLIDIIAGIIIITGDFWIGFDVLAIVLLLKGLMSLFS